MSAGNQRPMLPDRTRRRMLIGLAAAWAVPFDGHAANGVIVAAASDLRHALDAIIVKFERAHNTMVRVTYGSSGNLARQITQGAPFELFLAADESFADRLAADGHAEAPGMIYAVGRLALIARRGDAFKVDGGLGAVAAALAAGGIARFAIANPEHAPYGARAREALIKSGLWEQLQGRLVLAENVAQAAQYVVTGAAQAGIAGASLAHAPDSAALLDTRVLPADLHSPLRQRMVLTKRASPAARALYAFVVSAEAQAMLQAAGFEQP